MHYQYQKKKSGPIMLKSMGSPDQTDQTLHSFITLKPNLTFTELQETSIEHLLRALQASMEHLLFLAPDSIPIFSATKPIKCLNRFTAERHFMLRDKMIGGILFWSCLSVCLFVCLLSTLTFAITCEP